jgi:hypothetical protein
LIRLGLVYFLTVPAFPFPVEKPRQKDYNRNVMKNTTTDIYQVNDSFFHKIFDNPENARDFLERVLPDQLKKGAR